MGWRKRLKFIVVLSVLLVSWPMVERNAFASGQTLIPMGHSISIKMGLTGIYLTNDLSLEEDEWLKAGDLIETVNGTPVGDLTVLEKVLETISTEQQITLQLLRDGRQFEVSSNYEAVKRFLPFLKDRTEGTGTLTYVDPNEKIYGALGHQIIDSAFQAAPSFKDGTIHLAAIEQIRKSSPGNPGYKISATVQDAEQLGTIQKNVVYGIFGTWDAEGAGMFSEPLTVLSKAEVQVGKAEIYTTIKGTEVETFTIDITNVEQDQFHFTLTDAALLEATGGILQGMSGSPIIQNGKFAGAITHMFVDEPEKGAALFIETMRNGEN